MNSEDQISARWEELINEGILLPDSMDKDQEMVYTIDVKKLKEYDALLYEAYREDMDVYIAGMVGRDEIELLVDEQGEMFFVSEPWISK